MVLGTNLAQRPVQGAVEKIVDHAPVAEAHFVLGRMHVDVHRTRIDFQEQHEGRMTPVEQHVAIGLAYRVGHQLVAHHAAVDVEVLQIGLAARIGRQSNPAPQAHAAAVDLDRQRLLEERRAAHAGHSPRTAEFVRCLVQRQHGLAVVAQMEGDVEMCQSQLLDHLLQVIELGLLGLEKLASCRGVEEQVAHLDRGTDRVCRRLHACGHVATFGLDLPGLRRIGRARGQGEPRHRANRGQRLTAKAQTADLLQILQITDLAGGMPRQSQRQVVGGNPAAVVAHLEQLDAALLDFDVDPPRAGIQAVLQQFLDHRGRPLDHLTGSNLVRQPRAQQLDARHLAHGWAARVVAGISRSWPTLITSLFRLLAERRAARLT